MKKYASFIALVALLLNSCQPRNTDSTAAHNILTEEEKAAGWELLFDGTTLQGWKRYNRDSIGPLWKVQDGMLVCNGSGFGEGSGDHGGSLMTTRSFGNFELTVDWKVEAGGNSGILYHVVEDTAYAHDYETGPECQVLDDAGWKGELRESQKAGSNYDMFEAAATKKLNPAGQWNTCKVIYNQGHVEHWLNGEKVVEFDEGSADYQARYQQSKWVDYPAWNQSKTGAISLQDHGANVYFRNIKVRVL